jgi:hypothetical protein
MKTKMKYEQFVDKLRLLEKWDISSITGEWKGDIHSSTYSINCIYCGKTTTTIAKNFTFNGGKKCSCQYGQRGNVKKSVNYYHSFRKWNGSKDTPPTVVITGKTMSDIYATLKNISLSKHTTFLDLDEDNCIVKVWEI